MRWHYAGCVPCTVRPRAAWRSSCKIPGGARRGVDPATKPLERPIRGRDVLVVEDILDTGHSLAVLIAELSKHHPRSLRICVLVDKPERRVIPVRVDYAGFVVLKGFVVGYGIDYAERYRALPDLYRLDIERGE